jgi:GntR family transcriptional regulator of arabinose operon
VSKSDDVYQWLKEQFASNAIPVGERLPSEPELSRRFASSRPPVRQALARLIHEGLIETRQGKGSFRKAQSLAPENTLSSSDIAVLLPNLSDYIYPELVEAAGSAIRERGAHALFACSEGSPAIEADLLSRLFERRPRGLIVSPLCADPAGPAMNQSLLKQFQAAGIPLLVLDHELAGLSSLCLDDYEAGRHAATYLYELGHRRFGALWKRGHRPFWYRMQGYVDELRALGLPEPVSLCLPEGPETSWKGPLRAFLQEQFDLKDQSPGLSHKAPSQQTPPTSLPKPVPLAQFCANDTMALAVRSEALDLGLRIPQDFSLIGFDDSPLARIREIDLTSFRYPSRYLGSRAVELLFDQIERPLQNQETVPHYSIKIMPPLIERGSVLTVPDHHRQRSPNA